MAGATARWALVAIGLVACARRPPEVPVPRDAPAYDGPDVVQMDLIRPEADGPRIFVRATLPDGEQGLFLVDTGAAISALSEETADRLGLEIEYDAGFVEGLGGRAALDRGVMPTLALGDAVVRDVEFAVGVRDIPTSVGGMPLDGLLGNNVWARFVMELDYPADTLVLHRPGTVRMPRRSEPMFFDGNHIYAPITITTAAEPPHTDRVVIQVDTGASGLLIAGLHGRKFEQDYTEGLEPILGIGAAEGMPPHTFLRVTRRIPVAEIGIGGRTVTTIDEARWVNFEGRAPIGPQGLKGLAGHEILAGWEVLLDYQGGRIALVKSRRKPRSVDGHRLFLDEDVAKYGADPTRFLYRGKLSIYLDELDEAERLLMGFLDAAGPGTPDEEVGEARVLLAAVRRQDGDLVGAWEALAPLGAGQLVDQHEIVATINGLVLEERYDEAEALAAAATAERPEEGASWVALADLRFAQERWAEAEAALGEADVLTENPDGTLLRRARIAVAQGDRYGAMASVRRLLALYPHEGMFLWFYALLLDPETDGPTFRHDMEEAMARLHPTDRPLDFLVAAHATLGDADEVQTLLREGLERDCEAPQPEPSEDNCVAWYTALARVDLDEALRRVDAALAETGDRPDYLDTKAMVHLARGEYVEAHEAAVAAARLSPDDVYMLWQAARLRRMVIDHGLEPAPETPAARADAGEAAQEATP